MAQLLTLSRAARLLGITRGALQKKVKAGELSSFDGMVAAEELLRIYPEVQLEDEHELERVTQIRERAFGKRIFERALPDKEVLAARLAELGRALGRANARAENYLSLLAGLREKFGELEAGGSAEVRAAARSLAEWLEGGLGRATEGGLPEALAVRDSFLRIMAAHVSLRPTGHEFFVEGADTLLEAGLRSGLALSYGCSDGSCGLCKARVLGGEIKKVRHHGFPLSGEEQRMGYALLCANTAVTDLVIEAPVALGVADMPHQEITAVVKGMEWPTGEMTVLRLETPRSRRLRFLAGQSVVLGLDDGLTAEHPIASCPCEDRKLEFHIHWTPDSPFSGYVFNRLARGEAVSVSGPAGDFVLREDSPHSLVFIAFNTGFAPVKSLIEHALALDAAETLHLYWIASHQGDLYLPNLCRSWADALDNFRYTPLVAGADLESEAARDGCSLDPWLQRIAADHPEPAELDFYIAGPASLADAAAQFLAGRRAPPGQVSVLRT